MQGDEVQKQVAQWRKRFHQRTDELTVLRARDHPPCVVAPLIFGRRRRGAAPDRVQAEQHRRVFRVDGRMRTMTALQWQSSKR
jgi:hypothetical protein